VARLLLIFGQEFYMRAATDEPVSLDDQLKSKLARTMHGRLCIIEDVEGYVVQSVVVTLDSDGNGEDVIDRCDSDMDALDEYHCSNCDEYWRVEKFDSIARAAVWEKVKAHLPKQKAEL
jgi:hypothetical protein